MNEDDKINTTESAVFFSRREALGDKEAAVQSFAGSMKNFGISEAETRDLVEKYPGIPDLIVDSLTHSSQDTE